MLIIILLTIIIIIYRALLLLKSYFSQLYFNKFFPLFDVVYYYLYGKESKFDLQSVKCPNFLKYLAQEPVHFYLISTKNIILTFYRGITCSSPGF